MPSSVHDDLKTVIEAAWADGDAVTDPESCVHNWPRHDRQLSMAAQRENMSRAEPRIGTTCAIIAEPAWRTGNDRTLGVSS